MQSAITHLTLIDRHSVSRMIKKMVAKGWVTKTGNSEDGRGVLVALTAKARKEYPAIRKKLFSDFDPIFRSISRLEYDAMVRTAKKLRKALGE